MSLSEFYDHDRQKGTVMEENNYIMLDEETENTYKLAFFDCADNLYKEIFRNRGLTALLTDVFSKGHNVYKMVICDIDKKDAITFCQAMKDLVEAMNEAGHKDYVEFSRDFFNMALKQYR